MLQKELPDLCWGLSGVPSNSKVSWHLDTLWNCWSSWIISRVQRSLRKMSSSDQIRAETESKHLCGPALLAAHSHASPLASSLSCSDCSGSMFCTSRSMHPACPAASATLATVLSSGACRSWVVVLQPGVRPEPLRWESWVQDIGQPKTSQPHIISIGESSTRDLHLNAKIQLHSTTSNLQCWTLHAKQLARQEHNPTH